MTSQPNERVFTGSPASPGLAVGRAWRLAAPDGGAAREAGTPEAESAAFDAALASAIRGLEALIRRSREAGDELGADILEFQVALAEDEELVEPVRQRIAGGKAAHEAWAERMDEEIAEYRRGDEVMAARAADLADLRGRVLAALSAAGEAEAVPDGAILFAEDLAPSRFLGLDWSRIGGAVLSCGSPASHVSILARARGVPMLVDVRPAPDARPGEAVAIDAGAGRVVLSPGAATLAAFEQGRAVEAQREGLARQAERRPARTADGRPVAILLNVNAPADLDGVAPDICDGIGLTRTEFLFANGPPDEQTQYATYRRIVLWAAGRPVTIRLLDAGGDKPVPGVTLDNEDNPFLGTRGLRLLMKRPDILRTQLRAIARAAALGPVKVMAPMVTLPSELTAARAALARACAELAAEGVAHGVPPLGMMVEVPAAAMTAEAFDADFYSIGSNDLAQYVLAVARDAAGLSHLVAMGHEAVIELIARTVEAGRRRGVEVSLCGDMASVPEMVAALLATGLSTLSVAPPLVGRIKLAVAAARAGQP